jgi:hypothetical protein
MANPGTMLASFFDSYKLARTNDPETSKEAAEKIVPKIGKLQIAVLKFAEGRQIAGFIDLELNIFFGSTGSTYRTRRAELTDLGLIVATGMFRVVNGKRHTIWVHKDYQT